MKNQLTTINFNNQTIKTLMYKGVPHVAMKQIVLNLGLDWDSQRKRIKRDPVLSKGAVVTTVAGFEQRMACLPIKMLHGFLFGITVSRVKPELRETIIKYQEECYDVLHNHWTGTPQSKLIVVPDTKTITKDQFKCIQFGIRHQVETTGKSHNTLHAYYTNMFNVNSLKTLLSYYYPDICRELKINPDSTTGTVKILPFFGPPPSVQRNKELAVLKEGGMITLEQIEQSAKDKVHFDLVSKDVQIDMANQEITMLRHKLKRRNRLLQKIIIASDKMIDE